MHRSGFVSRGFWVLLQMRPQKLGAATTYWISEGHLGLGDLVVVSVSTVRSAIVVYEGSDPRRRGCRPGGPDEPLKNPPVVRAREHDNRGLHARRLTVAIDRDAGVDSGHAGGRFRRDLNRGSRSGVGVNSGGSLNGRRGG
jgi:hypothetical protein